MRRNLLLNTQQGIVLGSKGQPTDDWPEATEVHNNTIVDSVYNGIHVIAAVEPDLYNNIIVGTGQTAIRIDTASREYHEQNGGTIWVEANGSWDAAPPGPGIFYAIDGVWNAVANRTAAQLAAEASISGLGQEVNSDPLFEDAGTGDYSLSLSSPAIDAGLPTGEPFEGDNIDLGYLEWSPAGVPVPSLTLVASLLLTGGLGRLGAQSPSDRVVADSLLEGRDVPLLGGERPADLFALAGDAGDDVGGDGRARIDGHRGRSLASEQELSSARALTSKLFFSGNCLVHTPSGGTSFRAQADRLPS